MSDDAWTDIRERDKFAKAQNRKRETPLIDALESEGFRIEWFSGYHCRVKGPFCCLDLFPSTGKWHDMHSGRRGACGNLSAFVRETHQRVKAGHKAKKARAHVYRLWNLRTAAWASENRHMGDTPAGEALKERIARIKGADPRVQELARDALLITREDDTEYIQRRQASFYQKYPQFAK